VYRVGPGRQFRLPSEVAALARDGDVIEIDAGAYRGDVAIWRQDRLTLRGVGAGRAHLAADGQAADDKTIWVIKNRQTTMEHIEFSGAAVSDGNGAGIRAEGAGLVVRNCYFHDNQDGILGGAGDVVIERSEFAANGSGDGYTHNIYIGDRVRRFTMRYSYSHGAKVGHNLKSRARENFIQYNRIMDEAEGTSSYAIDFPNGGMVYLLGNLIHKGPRAENRVVVRYGAEGFNGKDNELYLVNNTLVNERPNGLFVRVAEGTRRTLAANNLFIGNGQRFEGAVEESHDLSASDAALMDRARYDYRLRPGSPAIDAGVDPGRVNGVALLPSQEYRHPLQGAPRPSVGAPDVGAYEFDPTNTPIRKP
jgi:hypothetical protein